MPNKSLLTLYAAGEPVWVETKEGPIVGVVVSKVEIGDHQSYVMFFPTKKMIGDRACAFRAWVTTGDLTLIEDMDQITPAVVQAKVKQVIAAIDQNQPVFHVYYTIDEAVA